MRRGEPQLTINCCGRDSPSALTGEEWQILYDYGVRTVIDLRSPNEVQPYAL